MNDNKELEKFHLKFPNYTEINGVFYHKMNEGHIYPLFPQFADGKWFIGLTNKLLDEYVRLPVDPLKTDVDMKPEDRKLFRKFKNK